MLTGDLKMCPTSLLSVFCINLLHARSVELRISAGLFVKLCHVLKSSWTVCYATHATESWSGLKDLFQVFETRCNLARRAGCRL